MAKRPLFLVSNDDGVFAKGLTELSLSLRDMGDVIVVAPDEPRSGSYHLQPRPIGAWSDGL